MGAAAAGVAAAWAWGWWGQLLQVWRHGVACERLRHGTCTARVRGTRGHRFHAFASPRPPAPSPTPLPAPAVAEQDGGHRRGRPHRRRVCTHDGGGPQNEPGACVRRLAVRRGARCALLLIRRRCLSRGYPHFAACASASFYKPGPGSVRKMRSQVSAWCCQRRPGNLQGS